MTTLPISFSIDLSDKMYYNMKDIFEYKPELFYGCTIKKRHIVKRKNIPTSEYVYANYFAKTNKWNLSDDNCKKSQLLISKLWVDKYLFKLNHSKDNQLTKIIPNNVDENARQESIRKEDIKIDGSERKEEEEKKEEKEDVENPPPILELKNSQKFQDIDGTFLEIEIRGERFRNKIYFRVRDVMKMFDMPNLNHTIREKTSNYKRGLHYKCFKCFKKNNESNLISNYRRSLYLTYYGFLKVITASRVNSEFLNKNINILTKWLDNLINDNCCDNYLLNFVEKNTSGLIYIISSPLIHAIKIGYWTGTINDLKSRYIMVFGKDIELYYKNVDNAREREQQMHEEFQKYNISGELFEKENLKLYVDFLENNIEEQTTHAIIEKEFIYNQEEDYHEEKYYFEQATKELQDEVARLKTEIIEMKLKHQLEVQEYKNRAERAEYINDLKEKHYQEIRVLIDKMNR